MSSFGSQVALHKKSGQKSDSAVNKDFLVSFWRFFIPKSPVLGAKSIVKEHFLCKAGYRIEPLLQSDRDTDRYHYGICCQLSAP